MKSRLWSAVLFLCAVSIGVASVWYAWKSRPVDEVAQASSEQEPAHAGLIHLPAEKIAAAGVRVVPIGKRALRVTRTVPGHIQYDDRRHIAVKAATEGVLIDVKVKPGDAVAAGQILAILSSPEVGTARAEVLERTSELKLLKNEEDWTGSKHEGLQLLVAAVQKRQSMDDIRKSLKDKSVGKSRETMMTAYSRFLLAEALSKSLASAGNNGALSGRLVAERQSEFESAEAALQAVAEQETFNSQQEITRAKNAVEVAENKLKISQQHLMTLLGYEEVASVGNSGDKTTNLSLVEVRAPFAGTIEQRIYSNSERVQLGDTLFILADTTQMWVAADLREGEWSAMSLQMGDPLVVTTPAMSGREFEAAVYYIGREVSSETNSVPLMATINNSDGLLRPGLFVRVMLPLGESREVLAVPASALCEHESKTFVFVPDGERSYRQVYVKCGTRDGDYAEIISGLKEGESVVDQGAFELKSELLLEREE